MTRNKIKINSIMTIKIIYTKPLAYMYTTINVNNIYLTKSMMQKYFKNLPYL